MLNLMIDLESFGLDDDAVLTQIGCVAYNDRFEIYSTFDQSISVVDSLLNGFSITPSTLEFWKRELASNNWDDSVIDDMFYSKVPCVEAAALFDDWLKNTFEDEPFMIWANGVLFDINKANFFLNRFGFKNLTDRTRYSNVEELRTLRKMTKRMDDDSLHKFETKLRAKYKSNVHNAVYVSN